MGTRNILRFKCNVHFLKTNSGKKGEGMPVVRNAQYYFKEGFCWNNVLNPQARLLKVKLKRASVNDVGSMSLMPLVDNVPSKFIIGLLNSNLIFDYYRVFLNCSVNIQINDLRQIPIIIPNQEELSNLIELVNEAILIKETFFKYGESDKDLTKLESIEKKIDNFVSYLYDKQS